MSNLIKIRYTQSKGTVTLIKQHYFSAVKIENFFGKVFLIFSLKSLEAILTSTHNLQCMYTPVNHRFTI